MKPTAELTAEHDAIKVMLEIIREVARRLDSGEKVSPEHLGEIVEFIRVFADKCHHAKEEELLFPAMQEAGVPSEGGPIGVMLEEHRLGREYVKGMSEGVARYNKGLQGAAAQIAENARNYADLLTGHIEKEDNILYPIADRRLSAARQEQLLAAFEKAELEKIGSGRHKELHEILQQLRDKYLGRGEA